MSESGVEVLGRPTSADPKKQKRLEELKMNAV